MAGADRQIEQTNERTQRTIFFCCCRCGHDCSWPRRHWAISISYLSRKIRREEKQHNILERSKNREDGSDFGVFLTRSIASLQTLFFKIFVPSKKIRVAEKLLLRPINRPPQSDMGDNKMIFQAT